MPGSLINFVLAAALAAPSGEYLLLADDWARPRSGERVAAMPALRGAVAAWLEHPGSRILVLYPGGETGSLWGTEVRDWLVALGVEPDHVVTRSGGPRDDAIVIRFEP